MCAAWDNRATLDLVTCLTFWSAGSSAVVLVPGKHPTPLALGKCSELAWLS